MFRSIFQPRILALAAILIAWAAGGVPVNAQQDDIKGGATTTGPAPRKSTPKPKPQRTVRKVTPVAPNTKPPASLSTLVVASEPQATITVAPAEGAGEGLEGVIPTGERLFMFSLPPGRYRVTAELDGYKSADKVVDVAASKAASLTLNLVRATYSVTIKTNIGVGEVVYSTGGGPARRATVQNGSALLADLSAGKYEVEIKTAEVGYQAARAEFTLPGDAAMEINLKRLLSKETLSAVWTNLDDWSAPAGWRAGAGKLSLGGAGVALPRNDNYRYYADFELSSDVRMVNGKAASFALRAVDAQHYYLIQLTGAKADEPHVLRGFIVKNGVPQPLGTPVSISGLAELLKPNKFFNVGLKMTGHTLEVSVVDSETGQRSLLGSFSDPNKNFSLGAVGLAARDSEQNEIGRFIVCAAACAAESPTYGAFQGTVVNAQTGAALSGASVQFTNEQSGIPTTVRTDEAGRLYQGLLVPGQYKVRVSAPGFKSKESTQQLVAMRANQIVPAPLALENEERAASKGTSSTIATAPKQTTAKEPKSSPEADKSNSAQASTPGKTPTPRYATSVRTLKPTGFAQPTPTTGALLITVEPNVTVFIESIKGGEGFVSTVPSSIRDMAFNRLQPGDYRIVATLEGFPPVEARAFVPASKIVQVRMQLRPKQ